MLLRHEELATSLPALCERLGVALPPELPRAAGDLLERAVRALEADLTRC